MVVICNGGNGGREGELENARGGDMSRSTAVTAAAVATGSVSTVPSIEFVPFTSPYSRTASPRPEGVTAALTILRFSTSSSMCLGLAQSGRGRSDCACKQPKVEGDAGKMPVIFLLRMSAVKWRFARLFHASGWSYLDSTETTSSRRDGCGDVRTSCQTAGCSRGEPPCWQDLTDRPCQS